MTLLIFFSIRKLQYQNTAKPAHLLATSAVGTQLMQDVSAEAWGRGTKQMNTTCKVKGQAQRQHDQRKEEN